MGEWTVGGMKGRKNRWWGRWRKDGRGGGSRGQRGTQKKVATWVRSWRSRKLTSLLYLEFSLGMCGMYLHFPYIPTRNGIWTREQIYLGTRCGPEGPEFDYRRGRGFSTHLDRLWGPPSLLYNGYRASFPRVEWTTHTSCAEVKERVILHLLPLWAFVTCSKAKISLFF